MPEAMTKADVIFVETQSIIDTGDVEAILNFSDVLESALDELGQALYVLTTEGDDDTVPCGCLFQPMDAT